MKYLLVLAVVLVGAWLWKSARQPAPPKRDGTTRPPTPSQPQDMVSCGFCGLHFPKADAVIGQQGFYCSTEHRQRAENPE